MPSFLTGYSKRKSIRVTTHPGSSLTDFPLYVPIAADSAIGAAAAADGANIRFTADDGTTALNFGRDAFSVSGGAATGRFIVKVPTIASGVDTTIYVYYDNPSAMDVADLPAAFNSNFKLRWSCDEDPSGSSPQILDSTSNANHGTATGMTSGQSVAAQVGNGIDFGATANYLSSTNTIVTAGNVLPKEGSVSFITKFVGGNTPDTLLRQISDSNAVGWDFLWESGPKITVTIRDTGNAASATSSTLTTGNRYHVAGVLPADGGTIRLFINGVADGTATAPTWATVTSNLMVGRGFSVEYGGQEVLDELRISSAARSADEIAWEYHNLFDSDHCLTFGAEETSGGGGGGIVPQPYQWLLAGRAA